MAEIAAETLLELLLAKGEAGNLPAKKVEMLKHLQGRVAAGRAITEMQDELLRDLGEEYGVMEEPPWQ